MTNLKNMDFKVIISPYANSTMKGNVRSILKCKEYNQEVTESKFFKFLSE